MEKIKNFIIETFWGDENNRKKYIFSILVISFIVIVITILCIKIEGKKEEILIDNISVNEGIVSEKNLNPNNISSEEIVVENTNEKEDNIFVHICGAVNNPGIVKLKNNSRIIDAVNAGGGLTANADISYVNLAYIVSDGIKIYIPTFEEIERISFEYISTECGANIIENSNNIGNNNSNIRI